MGVLEGKEGERHEPYEGGFKNFGKSVNFKNEKKTWPGA